MIKELFLPALIGMLALAALLWTGIGRGLLPLRDSAGGATVRISADASDQLAGIAVIDDGPGIPDDELESVRDRFVRGKREKGAGSGLGLSIVELVLERAGGVL